MGKKEKKKLKSYNIRLPFQDANFAEEFRKELVERSKLWLARKSKENNIPNFVRRMYGNEK